MMDGKNLVKAIFAIGQEEIDRVDALIEESMRITLDELASH